MELYADFNRPLVCQKIVCRHGRFIKKEFGFINNPILFLHQTP